MSSRKRGISGYLCIRNGLSLDYCFELAIESLLPICDEVVVCDSESSDGTRGTLEAMAHQHPKIRIIDWPWPNPVGVMFWYVGWINFVREQLKYDHQLFLDADECLSPRSYPAIIDAFHEGGSRMFRRLNFWKDAKHLAPEGHYCGHMVARFGPTSLWMPSDAPDPIGPQTMLKLATHDDRLEVFHYGALREPHAFVEKSKVMQTAIFNSVDSRLIQAQKDGVDWEPRCPFPVPLQDFGGKHPEIAIPWLAARGRL